MVCTQRLWHDGTAFCLLVYRMDLWFTAIGTLPNGIPSMEILGEAAAGKSTGDAMKFMADPVAKLPAGVGYSWTGLSYQEASILKPCSCTVCHFTGRCSRLAAPLCESWSIPFSVMLVVPLGVVGALLATDLRGLSNDRPLPVLVC